MKINSYLLLMGCFVTICSDSSGVPEEPESENLPNVVCTEQFSSRILIMSSKYADWNNKNAVIWDWNPIYDAPGLHPRCIPWFAAVSDVKSVKENTHILVTASGGAVALIRISDRQTIFCMNAEGNTHSAELLPDGNVVSASSTGNYLRLFNMKTYDHENPEKVRSIIYELEDAHGVVWDSEKKCIWASGMYGITRWDYHPDPENPSLSLTGRYDVKAGEKFHGHDIFPEYGTRRLFLTGLKVMLFDTETLSYEEFSNAKSVKSISKASEKGPVLITVPQEKWWTDTASFLENDTAVPFRTKNNMRFYKIRWMLPNKFSYP